MIQAATSINEQTLTFVPKLIVVAICLAIFGGAIMVLMGDFTQDMFARDPRDRAMIPAGFAGVEDQLWLWMVAMIRPGAAFLAAPIFGAAFVPVQLRADRRAGDRHSRRSPSPPSCCRPRASPRSPASCSSPAR